MERIHYADGAVLTGTEIARALLDFGEVLAGRGASATVDIPIRRDDGSVGRANFLIGPASQIVSETTPSDDDEIVDPELVDWLKSQVTQLRGAAVAGGQQSGFGLTDAPTLEYPDLEENRIG